MIAPRHTTQPTGYDHRALPPCLGCQLPAAPLAELRTAHSPRLAFPVPPSPAQRLTALASTDAPVTDHALLVLLGHFAQHLGLVTLLEAVPLAQKQVTHAPQTKLIQFLVAILAGIQQLQDLNDGPAPLVHDPTVPQAWGQPAFAHYSGVSRTLAAADATTLQAVGTALAQVSRPFIDREVLAILRTNAPLMVDIDLTGRPVSPTSTSYPDAAFGWMDDAVAKGYQSAISSLSGGPTGRLLLASQRYAGHAKSAECLQAAVVAVEAALQVRPRRRTELVQAQRDALAARLTTQQQRLATAQEAQATAQWKREQHGLDVKRWGERFHQQRARLERRVGRLSATVSRLAGQVAALVAEQGEVTNWLAQLTADNAAVGVPVSVVMRVDAGFATDANLAWLIEMGYTVLTKVFSGHTTKRLQRTIPATATWTPVGGNAEAVALGRQRIGEGRYAVEALQVRYRLPDGWRWTTLVWYDEAPAPPAGVWFRQYNGRQTVEAGIKENKAVFTLRRPLVRSVVGMQVQEEYAVFAANFVRWAAAWVKAQNTDVAAGLGQALREVKTLVRVVAQSRARVVVSASGCALVFEAQSAFAGAVLVLRGQPVYQTVLPLFTIGEITPQEVT